MSEGRLESAAGAEIAHHQRPISDWEDGLLRVARQLIGFRPLRSRHLHAEGGRRDEQRGDFGEENGDHDPDGERVLEVVSRKGIGKCMVRSTFPLDDTQEYV